MKKILITGASGFIGSFIVEEALRRGMETWAAVRPGSSRAWLQDSRIRFIELDFSSRDTLMQQLRGYSFDYVVHAAGVTKCSRVDDFYKVNTDGTRHLADALAALQMPLSRLVYLSSLSIFGAIHEQQPYQPISDGDTPQPNTHYGRSKLQAEDYLSAMSPQLPWVILRPTGVYGPREKDYYLMAKSISRHIDFSVGFKQQDLTFVYVKDVVQAVFLALEHGQPGWKYFLSDGQVYQSAAFSRLIWQELGRPWWVRVKAPLWVLRVVTFVGEHLGRLTGQVSALNNDKYHILRQRNWQCDIQPARDELGYRPAYDLAAGVQETIAWYRANGWL